MKKENSKECKQAGLGYDTYLLKDMDSAMSEQAMGNKWDNAWEIPSFGCIGIHLLNTFEYIAEYIWHC